MRWLSAFGTGLRTRRRALNHAGQKLGEILRILPAVKPCGGAAHAEQIGANTGVFLNVLVVGDAAHADNNRGWSQGGPKFA